MRGDSNVNAVLNLVYKGIAIPNIADNAASSPLTNFFVSLHTTWPGSAGSQTTGEVAYTNYARQAVARGPGWTVTGKQVSPAAQISFPQCGATGATANFFAVGTAASGAGSIIDVGVIGAAPRLVVGQTSDTLIVPGHGLVLNDQVALFGVYGLALPTGISEGAVLFVRTAPDADTITLSTTQGGATLDITGIGVGKIQRLTPHLIVPGYTPILGTGTVIRHE
jgi:hypothetical protein